MKHPDTAPGSSEQNISNAGLMSKPYMFSPIPYTPTRSPGVSPNMMMRFHPFTSYNMDTNNDYSGMNPPIGNTPSVMGQNINMNINRGDQYSNRPNESKFNPNYTPSNMMQSPAMNPFGNYGVTNASPSGFTPLRTNFRGQSPMFSPGNMDYNQYFNTSPNVNVMSTQGFGYQRTPYSMLGKPNLAPGGIPSFQPNMNHNRDQGKQGNDEDMRPLNPFGN